MTTNAQKEAGTNGILAYFLQWIQLSYKALIFFLERK